MNDLQRKRVAMIVMDGLEQIERTSPRESLEKAGAKGVLLAPKDGKVQGFKHHDRAYKFKVDMTLAKADPDAREVRP
ncbi:MAG: DJ-1/PfpI family protein [Acidobacteriota bacterium]|nr:DJ-1/PfpI family protein [Acidobacteriota bacterium]